jgi:hypothetical protein
MPFDSLLPISGLMITIVGHLMDFIAATVILISSVEALFPSAIGARGEKEVRNTIFEGNHDSGRPSRTGVFVKGLLFALEVESGNAILKAGYFMSSVALASTSSGAFPGGSMLACPVFSLIPVNSSSLYYFIGVLSIRIALGQTLSRKSGLV